MDDHELDDELGYPTGGADLDRPADLAGEAEANAMLRRLRAAEAEATRVRELAAEDMAQTMAWRDRRLDSAERTMAWARRSLEAWARANLRAGGPKTVTLPSGVVRLRKAKRRIELFDEAFDGSDESVASWAELAEAAGVDTPVQTTRKLLTSVVAEIVSVGPAVESELDGGGFVLHKAVGPNGEVVEGVGVLEPTGDSFSCTTAPTEEDLDAEIREAG
jgi:hypothetical protein